MATTVINVRDLVAYRRAISEGNYAGVHRPTIWGNPFSHLDGTTAKFRVATREEAILKFDEWLRSQPGLVAFAKEVLPGKVLGCWCRPKEGFKGRLLCHAQILAGLVDGVDPCTIE